MFQADYDLDGRLVKGLRRAAPGLDIRSAHEAGLEGLPDAEVLAFTAETGRVLISNDRGTMPGEFYAFIARRPHPGVILLRRRAPFGQTIDEIVEAWLSLTPEDFENRILWIPR